MCAIAAANRATGASSMSTSMAYPSPISSPAARQRKKPAKERELLPHCGNYRFFVPPAPRCGRSAAVNICRRM